MSPALRGLPRTRTFHRRRPWRAWWIATAVAIALNLAVVVVLSQISKLHYELPQTPIFTHRIQTVPPPPPTPPPPPPEPVQKPQSESLAVALPPLALPAQPTPSTLALPDLPLFDINRDLPLALPAFTTIAATSLPGTGTIPIGEPDQGAELEAVFDLERFYPRAARLRGITGHSRVLLLIDARGVVTEATVVESQPAGVFDRATEELGRNLRFRPAQTNGEPVPSRKVLVIDWTLK